MQEKNYRLIFVFFGNISFVSGKGSWYKFILVGLSILMGSCGSSSQVVTELVPAEDKAPAIILLIGDGMGLSHISAAIHSSRTPLAMEQMPFVGFHKTYSYSDLITDSAAGATAFACGIKTYNNSIGMGPDSLPCYTILEEAEDRGLATGLVATSTIVHATPAAFIAHETMRTSNEGIAADFLETDIDIFIGGGKRYFDRREEDDRNLIAELGFKGYVVKDYFDNTLDRINIDPTRKFAFFTADSQPVSVAQGRTYLSYATRVATEFLDRYTDKGFFLMIEGSQIDWANHANEGRLAIQEVLDFDRAVSEALSFARKRGNTLVIVTADHETGGMALNPDSKPGKVETVYCNNAHTATMVAVLAYGPGAEAFSGIYENTDIYHKMRAFLQFDDDKSAAGQTN